MRRWVTAGIESLARASKLPGRDGPLHIRADGFRCQHRCSTVLMQRSQQHSHLSLAHVLVLEHLAAHAVFVGIQKRWLHDSEIEWSTSISS